MTQSTRFSGKTVIITGSSTGIGEGIARRFHDEGANVVINARNAEKCAAVAGSLDPERTLVVAGDVSKPDFANEIVAKTVERFGGLDCLVNNAGVADQGMLHKMDDARIDRVIDINVKGVNYLSRAAIPELIKTAESGAQASIVNISSVSGTGGDSMLPLYNASKGAVTNLTRGLALQLGPQGVRVNTINPSVTRSDMVDQIINNEGAMKMMMNRMALKRVGEPEDIAAAVLYLLSDASTYVTGHTLHVDGGMAM